MVESAIKVDVPFDNQFFEFYKILKDSDSPIFPPLISNSEISSKTKEMEKKIKNETVKKHINILYSSLYKYCNNGLSGINMEKAVKDFEGRLFEATGIKYDINLVVDGNL